MPAEWRPHAGCLIAFPCRAIAGGDYLSAARAAHAGLAHAIAEFEPVFMVVRPQDLPLARKLLSAAIELIPLPIDDAWLRDSGPTFIRHKESGEVAGIDWQFNAWGRKYTPWADDDAVAGAVLRHFQRRRFIAPLVMEGGSFHTDGAGTIMTTEQCLLHRNRNPRLNRAEIEQLLCGYLGGERVLWLAGDERDTETDGHVDNVACFAGERHILLMADDGDAVLRDNHRRLRQACDAAGRGYTLTCLPRPQVKEAGEDLLASYINFYFTNGGIVMPSFGVREDEVARGILAALFSGRQVVQVPATAIVRGGGGIHCVTQQIPE